MLFIGIVLLLFSALCVVSPKTVWYVAESWKSNDTTEPSGFYAYSTRIGGILLALFSLFVIYVDIFWR
ncbi:hypothetical protein CN514_18720 [Bacillus sp. AFS001701]|uniref:DUF6199 family natural product biosynthesis protein n=1 Tax=Bacillus sp. AFS001701 TaxID=2033480 RepID=UPI000BF809EA|nr:DUF6199 family natural product biosynthesis protein [Bacillus sp. AFS001701]PET53636.1 hypothetical protein CN514_18720 [Bacillus sp. AFS001701]